MVAALLVWREGGKEGGRGGGRVRGREGLWGEGRRERREGRAAPP